MDYREATTTVNDWQYRTIDGPSFFGPSGSVSRKAASLDYPIRYFLWKTNREAWMDLDYWNVSFEKAKAALDVLQLALTHLTMEMVHGLEEGDYPLPDRTLRETIVEELDADEVLMECFDTDLVDPARVKVVVASVMQPSAEYRGVEARRRRPHRAPG